MPERGTLTCGAARQGRPSISQCSQASPLFSHRRMTTNFQASSMTENPYEPVPPKTPSDTAQREVPHMGPALPPGAARRAEHASPAWSQGCWQSLLIVPALAVTAFGLGSGRGLAFSSYVPAGIGVFLFFTAFSGLIGGSLALLAASIRSPRPAVSGAADLSAVDELPIAAAAYKRSGVISGKRRRRRWPWFVGIPLLLILAAAFIGGAYVGRLVDRRLAAAIAAADQDDPNWRLADLLAHRQPVPDSLNSAPVIDEILALIPDGWPESPSANPGIPHPARAQFVKQFDTLHDTPTNVRMSESLEKSLCAELRKQDKAVELARSLVKYPRGRHKLTIAPAVIDTLLPHVQGTRGVARLLYANAMIRAHDGDIPGALDSCRAIFAAARSIGDEPFLISHLVHIAIGESALDATWRVLGQGESSDAALAPLQELLLVEMKQPLLLVGVKGERAVLTEIIRRLGTGEIPISALSDGAPSASRRPSGAVAPWGKLWFDQQQAVALERMTEAVAIARRPIDERPASGAPGKPRPSGGSGIRSPPTQKCSPCCSRRQSPPRAPRSRAIRRIWPPMPSSWPLSGTAKRPASGQSQSPQSIVPSCQPTR